MTERAIIIGAIALVALIGILLPAAPLLLFAVTAPIGAVALLNSSMLRFGFVTFGGLIILQSSGAFTAPKLAYFAGCCLALGLAVLRTVQLRRSATTPVLRVFALTSLAWVVLVAVSLPVALSNDATPMNWMRDAIPYLLIAAVPFLALDVVVDLRQQPRTNTPLILFHIYGALTVIGFSAHWMTLRGYADFSTLDGLFFSTFAFPCAFFSYATAMALSREKSRHFWSIVATIILIMFLLTGTRSSVVVLLAPLAIILGQRRVSVQSILGVLGFVCVTIIGGYALFSLLPGVLGLDASIITERLQSIANITSDTAAAGQSFDERATVTQLTWEAFLSAPLLGLGPGHLYQWFVSYSREPLSAYTLDSPLSIPAKFGALGALVFLLTLWALFVLQRQLTRFGDPAGVWRGTVLGFLAITLGLSLLASPIDDKGFSFAIAFLLLLSLQQIVYRERDSNTHATTGIDSDTLVQPVSLAARQPQVRAATGVSQHRAHRHGRGFHRRNRRDPEHDQRQRALVERA